MGFEAIRRPVVRESGVSRRSPGKEGETPTVEPDRSAPVSRPTVGHTIQTIPIQPPDSDREPRVHRTVEQAEHAGGCSCPACAGREPRGSEPIPRSTGRPLRPEAAPVQGCFLCGDPSCKKGEKCGLGGDLGGLFEPGKDTMPVKFYNQQQGHGGLPREWEHAVPGKAYRDAGMGSQYKSAPVLGIPKTMHRAGVAGVGGGISSTGSSHSAQIWSGGLGKDLGSGDFAGALRKTVLDGMNAALHTDQDVMAAASGYVRLINGHLEKGQITKAQAGEIQNAVMDTAYKMQKDPKLFGKT